MCLRRKPKVPTASNKVLLWVAHHKKWVTHLFTMNTYLLAVTMPDWKSLIRFSEDQVGCNPCRGFSTSAINTESPSAFPACLDYENNPIGNLSEGHLHNDTFHHCFLSFGVKIPNKVPLYIRGIEALEVGEDCYIMSASAQWWFEYITSHLLTTCIINSQLQMLLGQIMMWMEKIGFKQMFTSYEKIKAGGSFKLKKR